MESYIPKLSEPARRWVRFFGLLIGIILLCVIAYSFKSVLTPILIAASLAYILNPFVTWCERKRGVQRLTTVIVVFALLGAIIVGGGFFLSSKAMAQVAQFENKLDDYVTTATTWLHSLRVSNQDADAEQPASDQSSSVAPSKTATANDWWAWVAPVLKEHGLAIARSTRDYVITTLTNIVNLISLLVLIPMFTFFFLWRFNDLIRLIHDHIPLDYRDTIVHTVQTIDRAMANFFRGRLIVCLIVGTLTGVGWSIVGVPYSLPLGLLASTLNLVPFMSLLALPPALVFAYLGAMEGGADASWVWPLVLTMGVYMIVQAIESFALSPAIEGRSSGLHPLAIVIALLIGAQLAGLLGMLLAIPVASTLKTLAAEFVMPELRRLAGHGDEPPPTQTATAGDDDGPKASPGTTPSPPGANATPPDAGSTPSG